MNIRLAALAATPVLALAAALPIAGSAQAAAPTISRAPAPHTSVVAKDGDVRYYCCDSVVKGDNPVVQEVLKAAGAGALDADLNVGVNCTAIPVVGPGTGAACYEQTVTAPSDAVSLGILLYPVTWAQLPQ